MKKTLIALLILLTAALVFTGCGGNDSSNPTGGSGSSGPGTLPCSGGETWFLKQDVPAQPGVCDAFTMYEMLININGDNYVLYETSAEYWLGILMFGSGAGPLPEVTWEETPTSEGTVVINGSTITFTDEEPISGTISSDRKKITLNNPDYDEDPEEPEFLVFIK